MPQAVQVAVFWSKLLGGLVLAAVLSGGTMIVKHERQIAETNHDVAALKSAIDDNRADTKEIRKSLEQLQQWLYTHQRGR